MDFLFRENQAQKSRALRSRQMKVKMATRDWMLVAQTRTSAKPDCQSIETTGESYLGSILPQERHQ